MAYILWRWAMMNPNSENYYFAPYYKQAKEIIWASNRIQQFGPREWLTNTNNTELRLRFENGSFIKLDGSDNVDSYRGVKPKGISIFDEYKDFRPEFYDAYDPNLDAHNSPLIIIGTPPEIEEHHFYHQEDEFKRDPAKAYFEYTSYENPHIDPVIIDKKRNEYYARGEGDVFEREYMVKRVFGGKNSIFPMLGNENVEKIDSIKSKLRRDGSKIQYLAAADPGSATCFAILLMAYNPYTKQFYCLDEIYETDQKRTSTQQIGEEFQDLRAQYYRQEWIQVYDEAATWFSIEYAEQFDEGWAPTHKAQNKKEDGLSLIKDMLLKKKLIISDNCKKLFWEMRNYMRKDNGQIPKENDHLIDCLRYGLALVGYNFNPQMTQKDEFIKKGYRGVSISQEFPGLDDWGDSGEDWDVSYEVD
jgi:hypothetical protein